MTSRTRRRLLLGCLALPVLILLADFVLWRAAERQLRLGVARWVAARQASGWTVTTGEASAGGWPLTASLSVPDLALSGGDPQFPGGLSWHAAELSISVALRTPGKLVLDAFGTQRLRLGNAPELAVTADRLEATLPLAEDGLQQRVRVTADNLRTDLPEGGRVSVAALDLRLVLRPAVARGDTAATFALLGNGIALPSTPPARWPLGPRVAQVTLDGALSGPLTSVVPLAARLAAWRDGGGTVQVHRLGLRWGPLDLSATATLSLDGQLQPTGSANTHITGQTAALDAMVAAGAIKPQAALAAKAVLSLIGTPASADAPASVEIPLTLQDRTLAMGRIPLVRLPQLAWPAVAPAGSLAQ